MRITLLNGIFACSSMIIGDFADYDEPKEFKLDVEFWGGSSLQTDVYEYIGAFAHVVAYTRSDQESVEEVLATIGFNRSEGVKQTRNPHDLHCTIWHMPAYKFVEALKRIK